jgi:predicted metal-dependent hydrolase
MTPGELQVVVLAMATNEQIDGVLKRRRAWVLTNWRKMEGKVKIAPSMSRLSSGAQIPFRGRIMRLHVEPFHGAFAVIEMAFTSACLPSSRGRRAMAKSLLRSACSSSDACGAT